MVGVLQTEDTETMQTAQERQLIAGLQARGRGGGAGAGGPLRLPDFPARHAPHEEPRRCGGSHAGRPDEGLSEGRRVPRGRGAFVLDLSDHFQYRDVAAAKHSALRVRPSRSANGRWPPRATRNSRAHRASRPTGRACRTRRCCGFSCGRRSPRAIEELPEIYRAPVVLRDIEGLTTEEASTRLKLKDQTLKSDCIAAG